MCGDKLSKQTLAELAFEKIKRDILLGEIQPGNRLNIEELKRKHAIGLTPIREALNRLVSLGFVEFIGLKGFKVTQLSKQDLKDIYAIRQLIEIQALSLALDQKDDEWEAKILASYHRLSKLEHDKKFIAKPDIGIWMSRYQDFHFTIISGCSSNWLLTIDKLLFEQSERYRYVRMFSANNLEKLFSKKARAHKKLIEYIIARDKKAAIKLFSQLLDDTINDLLALKMQDTIERIQG